MYYNKISRARIMSSISNRRGAILAVYVPHFITVTLGITFCDVDRIDALSNTGRTRLERSRSLQNADSRCINSQAHVRASVARDEFSASVLATQG